MIELYGVVPKIKPYAHQITGVRAMVLRHEMALLDDVGLGKSMQALLTLQVLTKLRQVDCGIVVTKASLIEDPWTNEISKHSNYVPYVVSGRSVANRANWPIDRKIYLINYELLSRSLASEEEVRKGMAVSLDGVDGARLKGDAQNLLFLLQQKRCAVFLDESHAICNPDSNVSRCLHALRKYADRRYILTATLVADKPEDVWSQVYFLDGGKLLGRSFPAFLATHVIQGQSAYGPVSIGYKDLTGLHKKLKSNSLRRVASECLDLPPKIKKTRSVKCEGKHATVMRALCAKAVGMLSSYSDRTITIGHKEPLGKVLNDLQRASVAPWLIDPSCKTSCKMNAILDIFEESTHPILVWCFHKTVAEEITKCLLKAGIKSRFAHGGVPVTARNAIVNDFADKKFRGLVATMHSMSTGKNKLVVSSQAVYAQHSYSYLHWTQSQGRLHRIGQTKTVVIESVFMNMSMDRYIYEAVQRKEINANITVDGAIESITLDRVKLLHHLQKAA